MPASQNTVLVSAEMGASLRGAWSNMHSPCYGENLLPSSCTASCTLVAVSHLGVAPCMRHVVGQAGGTCEDKAWVGVVAGASPPLPCGSLRRHQVRPCLILQEGGSRNKGVEEKLDSTAASQMLVQVRMCLILQGRASGSRTFAQASACGRHGEHAGGGQGQTCTLT
jgi:hypothetical protein